MVHLDINFGSNELTEPKLTLHSTTYFVHPQYDRTKKHHDIALIKLPERVIESGRAASMIYQRKH